MNCHYILKHRKPIECDDLVKFSKWFERVENRRVRSHYLPGGIWVSTVFLGIDHGFPGYRNSPPILFETMAFDSEFNELTCRRCSTWRQALHQHANTRKAIIKNEY